MPPGKNRKPKIIKRACTKNKSCIPREVKENEFWAHEDAFEINQNSDIIIRLFKCPNCNIEFEVDKRD